MVKAIHSKTPNPGTQEAIDKGCQCPRIDNHYGKGIYEDGKVFIYNMDCKLHTAEVNIEEDGELTIRPQGNATPY